MSLAVAPPQLRRLTCGALLGFLPYNWKPAVIFLGDCGSLLLGYLVVVVILMLGEHGQTHLVFAGLIVFALPIIDTTLAIIRRRLAGVSMSAADATAATDGELELVHDALGRLGRLSVQRLSRGHGAAAERRAARAAAAPA